MVSSNAEKVVRYCAEVLLEPPESGWHPLLMHSPAPTANKAYDSLGFYGNP